MRGATCRPAHLICENEVSTHAPHARCDDRLTTLHNSWISFYSRTPCEVRHLFLPTIFLYSAVSTHAPHARCDNDAMVQLWYTKGFYSRTPCEVRQQPYTSDRAKRGFLLTHPMRGATRWYMMIACHITFLLTHPMRGATVRTGIPMQYLLFLLTHPMRGATRV